MNRSLPPQLTSSADRRPGTLASVSTNNDHSSRVLDEIMAEVFSQENQPDRTDVLDGQRVHRQIPSGVLDNQYFQTLRQAREAALATARQLGPGYTIKQHANPAKGTAHFHVASPAGRKVSGHFFYGEKPRFIPKTQDIPAHRRRKMESNGRIRRELGMEQESTAQNVISPCIDVHAQYAIQRMLKSPDPMIRQDGTEMLAAVKAGKLNGIYKEDQRVPAFWAGRGGRSWWTLIPTGKDAQMLTSHSDTILFFTMIVFRNSVRSTPQRLDPALRAEWRAIKPLIDRIPVKSGASCLKELNRTRTELGL